MIKPEGGDESAKSHEEWGGSGIASTASGAQWGQLREDGVVAADGQTDAQVSVGRYVLRGELGRGGMGQVLVAWDALLGRTVALKRVLPERQNRAQSAARLAREARITSVLEHPAIVPVLDAGYDDTGEPFYVMRLIRGRTLTEASLNAPGLTGRLSLLRHFLQACEAVAFAHRAGVVHRDLKPDNVLVGEFGETQVADWGLARWIDGKPPSPSGELIPAERSGPDSPERDPQMTAEDIDERGGVTAVGTILGTPAYMSPEQALGQTVGPSGDVYSLGVMLWHLVAGHSPFAGRSASDALALAADGVLPSLRGTCAAAPAELAAIVEHATMPRREDRYPDARARR
ncbi:MAG: serine/threonine protein kinase [Myxococcales bacterium]|nr:serine/threonine protein kinase [Myxococcales bacterium]